MLASMSIKQFGIYSAKILNVLYDSFPIPVFIDRNEVISQYLSFDQVAELERLRLGRDMAELVQMTNDETEIERAQQALPDISSRISNLEESQRSDRNNQEKIYDGTISFLVAEGLIRPINRQGYQLTAKGFSHLNKKVQGGGISDSDKTYIVALRSLLEKSSAATFDIAAGTAVNVITKLISY